MKKCLGVLLSVGIAAVSFADKPKLEPYGFVKGDMYYTIGGVSSWGQPALTSASQATGLDTNAMSFTAQHTRLGLKGSGASGDIVMGGQIEVDFFAIASNFNAKPRMRLAYAWCKPLESLEIRTGQDWDIFSPLNPTTNNTNANLWYDGNYGFRRPQLEARYGKNLGFIRPVLQVSIGEATKEDELAITQASDTSKKVTVGSFLGADNLAGRPLTEGRLGIGFLKNMEVGIAAIYGAYGKNRDYSTTGVSIDANLPFDNLFALKFELASGTNLNNANLFTIGGNGTAISKVTTTGYWTEAISKPLSYVNIVAGFGYEMVNSTVAAGKVESNMTAYGDLIFPIGEYFSMSLEYQMLNTKIKDKADANVAHVIDIAGKVTF